MRYILSILLTLALAAPLWAADLTLSWTKNAESEVTGYFVQIGSLANSTVEWGEMRDATAWDEEQWIDSMNNTRTDCSWVWAGAPDTGYIVFRVAAHDAQNNAAWNMQEMVMACPDCIAPPVPSGMGW